jgi:tetratricopeptide (TPR) repeat protein
MIHPSNFSAGKPSRSRRSAVSVVLAVLAATAARRAPAADPPPGSATSGDDLNDARLFGKALLHYDTHEYDEAIDLFRKLYERTRAPALLFNLAQAYRLEGDCLRAVDHYHEFIRRDPTSPDVARAKAKLAELEPCKSKVLQSAAVPAAEPPPPDSTALLAYSPIVTKTEPALVRGGTSASLRAGGVVLGAVGICLAAAASYYARRSSQAADEISGLFARGGGWDDHFAEVDARGRAASDTATTLFVFASVSVVLGVAGYIYGWKTDKRASP